MRNHRSDIIHKLGPLYISVGYKFYPDRTYKNRITLGFAYGKFWPEKEKAFKAYALTIPYGIKRSVDNA